MQTETTFSNGPANWCYRPWSPAMHGHWCPNMPIFCLEPAERGCPRWRADSLPDMQWVLTWDKGPDNFFKTVTSPLSAGKIYIPLQSDIPFILFRNLLACSIILHTSCLWMSRLKNARKKPKCWTLPLFHLICMQTLSYYRHRCSPGKSSLRLGEFKDVCQTGPDKKMLKIICIFFKYWVKY